MSQMPDKIWLHKDTKYSTADEVFGYQYNFAEEILANGIENYVEYIPKYRKKEAIQELINKACGWLKNNKDHPFIGCEDPCLSGFLTEDFINEFKKAMEEQLWDM